MKLLLPTLGSVGDIHPFLAIGQAARARGHQVEVITNPLFGPLVAKAGLDFHAVGTAAQFEETYRSPKLWHPVHGFGVFWRRMARFVIEPVYQRISEHRPGQCVVLATPLMLGARLAQERLGVPLVTAYTAATMLRSCRHPMTLAQWRLPRWLPRGARALAWRALDRWKLEPMVAADLPPLRAKLGLRPLQQSVFGQWVHSPSAGVTLFPDWFAPRPDDWPPQVREAGFPLFDGDSEVGLDPGLLRFLDDGAPPIVFTTGSAMAHGHAFFDAAVRSCESLGRRGVLLTPESRQIPAQLPESMLHCAYAPFGLLLLRAAALVHHGGVGNCAQALRAGIPQLVMPYGFDQFDNAMRLEMLGVGAMLEPADRSPEALADALEKLLNSEPVAEACRRCAGRLVDGGSANRVCELLERQV